jgi:hypothetical protein
MIENMGCVPYFSIGLKMVREFGCSPKVDVEILYQLKHCIFSLLITICLPMSSYKFTPLQHFMGTVVAPYNKG